MTVFIFISKIIYCIERQTLPKIRSEKNRDGAQSSTNFDLYFMSQVKSYRDVTPFTQYEKMRSFYRGGGYVTSRKTMSLFLFPNHPFWKYWKRG